MIETQNWKYCLPPFLTWGTNDGIHDLMAEIDRIYARYLSLTIGALLGLACNPGSAESTSETGTGTPACSGDMCSEVASVHVGYTHACALSAAGAVICWGDGSSGRLGVGELGIIGDDELPSQLAAISLGGPAVDLSTGDNTCALLEDGALLCWGSGKHGALGYGDIEDVGDDESPVSKGTVNVGFSVSKVSTGGQHTCALSDAGEVRCWGKDEYRQLGRGLEVPVECRENVNDAFECSAHPDCCVGDDEFPEDSPLVALGGAAVDISAGVANTCALLDKGAVVCWGANDYGQLGYGTTDPLGVGETPESAGTLMLGGEAVEVVVGGLHSCARMRDGKLRCWGLNNVGQLGLGTTDALGDDEHPNSVPPVELGGRVMQVSVGLSNTCALIESGELFCWGLGSFGTNGQGNTEHVGDDESPMDAGSLAVGGKAVQASVGFSACAVLEDLRVRCWGVGGYGLLGNGTTGECDNSDWCKEKVCCVGDEPDELPPATVEIF